MVKYIKDMTEFNAMLETSKSKLVVVDFTATWCGYVPFRRDFSSVVSHDMPLELLVLATMD